MDGSAIFVVLGLLVAAVFWWNWAMAPICPRCGESHSKRYPHQRKDGGPDRRYANNPLTCAKCGHEGDAVSRKVYKAIRAARESAQARQASADRLAEASLKPTADQGNSRHARSGAIRQRGQARGPRRWIPAGTSCEIAGRLIPHGMLYVIDGTRDQEPFNPATIIVNLDVGNARAAADLGYWPCYYFLTPDQRAAYLDWLAGGRTAADTDLGHVFLLLYGFEWRALVEGESRSEISREIVKLYTIYGRHGAFHDYALNLLGALLLLSGRATTLDPILKICNSHAGQHGGLPPLLLDGLIWQHAGRPLPMQWAREIANASAICKKGVAQERNRERFEQIFSQLFTQRYPDGIPIPTITEPTSIPYMWALRGSPVPELQIRSTGLLIGPSGKKKDLATAPLWEGLREIWHQAAKQTLAEQRVRRTSAVTSVQAADEALVPVTMAPGAGYSAADAGEPLPAAVAVPNPFEKWYSDTADDAGIAKTTLGDLYERRLGPAPAMLTPTQQMNLGIELDRCGLAVEPDLRPNCRRAAKEEIRFVYRVDAVKWPSARCQKFRPLVEAAVAIASSDGSIDDAELEEIVGHLDQKDSLSPPERHRLRLFASWLTESRQFDLGFNRLRHADLSKAQRKAIAALGIAIVLRDGKVTDAERKAIARFYRALELPEADLDELLKPPTQERAGVTIDWNAVAKLQAETHEVQGMLAQVLANDDGANAESSAADGIQSQQGVDEKANGEARDPNAAPPPALPESSPYPGLDPRAAKVLSGLSDRKEISASDLKSLCAGAGLLPSAAIDLINEWSDTHLGDRCIDGDGPYQIANHLIPMKA